MGSKQNGFLGLILESESFYLIIKQEDKMPKYVEVEDDIPKEYRKHFKNCFKKHFAPEGQLYPRYDISIWDNTALGGLDTGIAIEVNFKRNKDSWWERWGCCPDLWPELVKMVSEYKIKND